MIFFSWTQSTKISTINNVDWCDLLVSQAIFGHLTEKLCNRIGTKHVLGHFFFNYMNDRVSPET